MRAGALAGCLALAGSGHRVSNGANAVRSALEDRSGRCARRQIGWQGDSQSKCRIANLHVRQCYSATIGRYDLIAEGGIIRAGHAGRRWTITQAARIGAARTAGDELADLDAGRRDLAVHALAALA